MRRNTIVFMMIFTASALALPTRLFADGNSVSHQVNMTVREVGLIGLNNSTPVNLVVSAPSAGEMNAVEAGDSSKFLQYTLVIASGMTRNITVNWAVGDQAPAGTSLWLVSTGIPGNCGTAAAALALSDTPQNLITGIGSCHTGANGVRLQYNLRINKAGNLLSGDSGTATISFTLTDAS